MEICDVSPTTESNRLQKRVNKILETRLDIEKVQTTECLHVNISLMQYILFTFVGHLRSPNGFVIVF